MGILQNLVDLVRLNHYLYHASAQKIARYQSKAVLGLVARARRDSPFYREIYGGRDARSLEDFARLPMIDKSTMMANFDALNTAGLKLADVKSYALEKEQNHDYLGYYQGKYVIGLSSGTSGNKGIYVTDKALTRRLPGVFLARGGVGWRDLPLRILFILRVFSQGFADINAPLIQLHYLPSMTEPEAIIEQFNKMRANILMAPPSLLRQLLYLASRLDHPPRRIITYAEVLEKEEKVRIGQAFRAPVVEIYQASEGQIASPCRCGSLHINEDLVYVELLGEDGRTPVTRPGQRASRMLVTNLVNTVQPLLRYEMNDLIVLGEPCPCGSHFRVIDQIIGRNDDVLYLTARDGKPKAVYPDLVSRWIITTDDRIREFHVRQITAGSRHRAGKQQPENHLEITLDLFGADASGVEAEQTADSVAEQTADSVAEQAADICTRLERRLADELAVFGISCHLTLHCAPILMPADNRKMKRFERD